MMLSQTGQQVKPVNFDNLEVAFKAKSNSDLTRAYWLFKAISSNFLVNNGPALLNFALAVHIPVIPVIRGTIFKHFCGGEDIEDCNNTIKALAESGIGSVLDYSVEGEENESTYEHTCNEILATIDRAKGDHSIPFCVFKVTGISDFKLLEKASRKADLTEKEKQDYDNVYNRIHKICSHANNNDVRVFVDAEESWIQNAIDDITTQMMKEFNRDRAIIFNTIQLYRHDRLEFLKNAHKVASEQGYKLGLKLVRGAYMEKERDRAAEKNYPSPIQPDLGATNRDYDSALKYCIEHFSDIAICAGTHNESSSHLLIRLMYDHNIPRSHPDVWFSQLLGMSDHISYNLANAGYNVAKYVPYGPVKSVLPYLIRRAQENTSIAGQTGRELRLIMAEKKRRRENKTG